jgi:hypothetical protein
MHSQAQVCLSRARETGDSIFKELYEMAVDSAHNAAREQHFNSLKPLDWEGSGNRPEK